MKAKLNIKAIFVGLVLFVIGLIVGGIALAYFGNHWTITAIVCSLFVLPGIAIARLEVEDVKSNIRAFALIAAFCISLFISLSGRGGTIYEFLFGFLVYWIIYTLLLIGTSTIGQLFYKHVLAKSQGKG